MGSGILFELDYVLAGLHAKRGVANSDEKRRHLFDQMRRAFPGSEIDAPKDRDYAYSLHDPDDGHIAHAAIIGKADAIVTDDTRAGFGQPQASPRPTSRSSTPISSPRTRCRPIPKQACGHSSKCRSAAGTRLNLQPRSSMSSSSGTT